MHVYLGTHPWRRALRLIFFLSNKQADDYFEVLGYQAHAADKIRNYRDPNQRNRQVALLPACMST